jgi:hypothetical protein
LADLRGLFGNYWDIIPYFFKIPDKYMKFHENFTKNIRNKCGKFQRHNIITQYILHKRICIYQLTRSNEQNCFNVIVT